MRANAQQPTSVQEQAGEQAKNTQNDLGAPSWLRVKSKIKAGPGGSGEKDIGKGPVGSQKVRGPSWLRVKTQLKAGPGGGGGEKEFGKGPAEPKKAAGPTWLRVKTQLKAGPGGEKDIGKGSAGYHRTDLALTRLAARIKRPFTD